MIFGPARRALARWQRRRRRWPLTRQIAILFTALMIGNAVLVSTALDIWSTWRLEAAVARTSPAAQRAFRRLSSGTVLPTTEEIAILNRELRPVQDRLTEEVNSALYTMIALAGLITMTLGYLVLGRLGKGLGSVAAAARRIADGDLKARAGPVGFASREETQLIGDFNAMAAALQRADRELAESTAGIAHELRTPLTILRGRLHGIADGVFAQTPAEIDGLLGHVEGLGRLVDDLQTLSLANSQRLILMHAPTDLAEEVRRVLATTMPDLEAAGLDPVLALASAPLVADGARLRQIVAALLANACRYARNSGVLRVATRAEVGAAILEIVDHGPGLPDGGEARAFDRFWRGEASRSRHTGGTGLGLAVVRAIVEAHGGQASLANHAGGGTIFEMRLPAAPALAG